MPARSISVPDANAILSGATDEEKRAASEAYEKWADQFPIAAARRDFYGLSCSKAAVEARFLFLAEQMGLPAREACEIFSPDMWVLCEPSEKIPDKVEALRSLAETDADVIDFVRAAPRVIGTTTVAEMRERGLLNMRIRAAAGELYELLISPARLLFKAMAKMTASSISQEREAAARGGSSDVDSVERATEKVRKDEGDVRKVLTVVLFGGIFAVLILTGYVESTQGGFIHGKGVCPSGPWASYSQPDAAGNTGIPCNCAPIYKWYMEPQDVEQKVYPKLRSGKFDTVGGCVWTAEDLAKDPSYWDGGKQLTYWEKRRLQAVAAEPQS